MEYNVIYSKRKTISLRVLDDGSVCVRAPKGVSKGFIDKFVSSHLDFIEDRRMAINRKAELFSGEADLENRTMAAVMPFVEKYSSLMGVSPGKIRITSAKKRFGSCSSSKTVCFSKYLCLYPADAIEYVVVHELAHLIHMNHSPAFHNVVKKYLPDATERKKLLKI